MNNHTNTKRMPIGFTAILFSVALAVCSFLVYVYVTNLTEFIHTLAETSLRQTGDQVMSWLDGKEQTLRSLEQAYLTLDDSPELFKEYMHRLRESDPELVDLYIGTAEDPEEGGSFTVASGWIAPPGWYWTKRPWYVNAQDTDLPVLTDPYVDASTGQMVLSISKRVVKDGKVLGVVGVDIFMTTINTIVNDSFITQTSVLNLIAKDGKYLSHETNAKIQDGYYYLDFPEYVHLQADVAKGTYRMRMDLLDNSYFASMAVGSTQWVLVAQGVLSDFYDTAQSILALAFVLLLLIVLFVVLLARSWGAYAKLQVALEVVERTNTNLEKTVTERTQDLQNILDSAGEGFLTFGQDLTVNPGYSKGCEDIFQKKISGLHIADVLFPGRSDLAEDLRQGFTLYFNGNTRAEVIFDLVEHQTIIKDKIISLDYKETSGNKVLCILRDITLETNVKEAEKAEAQRNQRLLRALQNRHFFVDFMALAESVFSVLDMQQHRQPEKQLLEKLTNEIHTLKSDCGFFNFVETQEVLHDCETQLSSGIALENLPSFKELALQIRRPFYKELKTITEIMGEQWLEEALSVSVPRDAYYKIIKYVQKNYPKESRLLHYLEFYRKVPLSELFARLPVIANATAQKLGKQLAPMVIQGGDLRVLPEKYSPLAESCVHLINNMIDHGIEYAYEREAYQKIPAGKLELLISVDKTHILLEFKDDGKGINAKDLAERAMEKGKIERGKKYAESEILKLVFVDGFSTKKDASMVSGRGIGLSVVKKEVERLGGTIDVRSRLGKGTVFEIALPKNSQMEKTEGVNNES